MKPKVEKTPAGKVKAVGLKRKKVKYGDVTEEQVPFKHEGEYTGPVSEEPKEAKNATHAGGSGNGEQLGQASGVPMQEVPAEEPSEEVGDLSEFSQEEQEELEKDISEQLAEMVNQAREKVDEEAVQKSQQETESETGEETGGEGEKESTKPMEARDLLEQLLSAMKDDLKEKQEQEKADEGKSEEQKQEEQEKRSQQQQQQQKNKQRNEILTEYLVLNLRLRALAEILGAVKVAQEGKHYYSFVAIEGKGVEIFKSSPAKKGIILDFDTFPWFDEPEKAQAFLELCAEIINRYCHLLSYLNPVAITNTPDIEVIHS